MGRTELNGHCVIDETYKAARYHGMTGKDLDLVYSEKQKRQACKECGNLFC